MSNAQLFFEHGSVFDKNVAKVEHTVDEKPPSREYSTYRDIFGNGIPKIGGSLNFKH